MAENYSSLFLPPRFIDNVAVYWKPKNKEIIPENHTIQEIVVCLWYFEKGHNISYAGLLDDEIMLNKDHTV